MSWLGANIDAVMVHGGRISTERYAELLPIFIRQASRERPKLHSSAFTRAGGTTGTSLQRRQFHDYFVTHLPSSSLHPDSRPSPTQAHKFDRKASTPHTSASGATPATSPAVSRDTTVVRIPLKSAKHHFGACVSRGSRPYNEDSHQAGVVNLPAFSKRPPKSVSTRRGAASEVTGAGTASGDPQIFYFGVFDGHGGAECSGFLKEQLHGYIERAAEEFHLRSTLQDGVEEAPSNDEGGKMKRDTKSALDPIQVVAQKNPPTQVAQGYQDDEQPADVKTTTPKAQEASQPDIRALEMDLIQNWKRLVGGYFRRFKPAHFSIYADATEAEKNSASTDKSPTDAQGPVVEEVIAYSFLKADYDFVAAQAAKEAEATDQVKAERPLNDDDHIIGSPEPKRLQTGSSFKGGSTCSVVFVSTPTPAPFWNPSTPSSILVAHVGDTRVLLCSTATGAGVPLTTDHHPSSPIEATRLRRYAATFVTDSFGEERISGLANTRAFGDIGSKRIGVSAEPEIRRVELGPAEYSFLVLISDGVSGTLSDQEIVDIVKEAKTPEQAARDVVGFATEVSTEGDNATCLVVRLGGWERRQEGGFGSMGTKESRDYKRQDALDPRNRRQ